MAEKRTRLTITRKLNERVVVTVPPSDETTLVEIEYIGNRTWRSVRLFVRSEPKKGVLISRQPAIGRNEASQGTSE